MLDWSIFFPTSAVMLALTDMCNWDLLRCHDFIPSLMEMMLRVQTLQRGTNVHLDAYKQTG
jgi:hypothetical protein